MGSSISYQNTLYRLIRHYGVDGSSVYELAKKNAEGAAGRLAQLGCWTAAHNIGVVEKHMDVINALVSDRKELMKFLEANNKQETIKAVEIVDRLLDARGKIKPRHSIFKYLGEFQLGSGTRIGEACAIEVDDVNLLTGEATINKTVQWSRKKGRLTRISQLTKTGKSRQIFLTERAVQFLKMWLRETGRIKGLIFSYDGTTPLSYRAVQFQYDLAFKSLGMKWRATHILRHSYATDFLEKTGDKIALQGQLGHASSRQTDHYAKITANSVKAGVKAYDKALRGSNVVDFVRQERQEGEKNLDGLGESGSKKEPAEIF